MEERRELGWRDVMECDRDTNVWARARSASLLACSLDAVRPRPCPLEA